MCIMPTMKQFDAKITEILNGDTSLSKDAVLETIATKLGVSVDVLQAAFNEQVKLGNEITTKMAEILEMGEALHDGDCEPGQHMVDGKCVDEAEHPCGPGETPEKDGCVEASEAEHPCGPGETPEKDGCVEPKKPKASELTETLENTFGKDDLKNGFNSVLEAINNNKDPETKKYLAEVMRRVFEVMPKVFKTDEVNKKTIDSVKSMEVKIAEQGKIISKLQVGLKVARGLSETIKKKQVGVSKGLYEQKSAKEKKEEKTNFEKQTLSETVQGSDGRIPVYPEKD